MKKRSSGKSILFPCVVLILVLVMLFSGLRILESTVFLKGEELPIASKTIERDGIKYFPRQDITVVMLLGIDQNGKVESSNAYNNPGASDVVSLLIFDEKNENLRILCISLFSIHPCCFVRQPLSSEQFCGRPVIRERPCVSV